MLKLGGKIGLDGIGKVGGYGILGCLDCRRLQVWSLFGAIPQEENLTHLRKKAPS